MNNILQKFPGNNNIFRRDFTVRYSEVNKFGILKMQSLFDYLQQAAAEHANSLGCGMKDLYGLGMMWVLSKMSINIMGAFAPEQKITVCTYPFGIERLHFRREFEIFDSNTNEILVQGSSFWLLLNAEKLRPLRREALPEVRLENPELGVFIPQIPTAPENLPPMEKILTSSVRFSQMDINQHLNNSQYAALTEDAVFEKLQKPFAINEIHVSFLQAQKYPDEIISELAIAASGDFQLESRNSAQDRAAFTAFGKLYQI